ncbi:MAG: EAL domain-containing protein [Parasphingorhabdus sp.]|uniref:putative bifunctional diguanylate cyclase/phosphodiesterase n=1 Tax=Parasphingorhabdus sp. TaxID=2709688 RepID=UPI003296DFEA
MKRLLRQIINSARSPADRDTNSIVSNTYRPIIRTYFGVTAAYYALMTLAHFWWFSGTALSMIAAASTTACIFISVSWYALRKQLSVGKLELLTGTTNLLVLINVLVALHLEYAEAKLIYFIMMAIVFGFASVTIRQALISIAGAILGLFYTLITHDPSLLVTYGFISFAASLCTVSITSMLRRAIGLAVAARHEAEIGLDEAQSLGETMRQRSLSDSLTGLPNRRAFFEILKGYKTADGPSNNAWLILLDLDGFKAVNDVHGHIMGDELLKAVADRLSGYCGSAAHLSRMGGDEFNIILPTRAKAYDVELWCQQLLPQISKVYNIEGRLIQISGSIGCTEITANETETQSIRNADYALLHAKRNGKNRVVVFSDEHEKDALESFRIEKALRAADFASELELLFQPQFDLGQNKIVRVEALARWNSPTIGEIGPDRFIKVAEESGLIANITLAVLKKALATLKSWDHPFPLSINLSGNDLMADQTIGQIIQQVKDSELSAALLEFEVTETAMMADTQKASANLFRLSELGHPIALDDFGTGYSNFNYLRTLPINKLKIDRSFIENLGDPMTEKILHSLVGMALTLRVECLLEGIENELQLVMAKRAGVQSVQGYLCGMPMTAKELIAFFETNDKTEEWQQTA